MNGDLPLKPVPPPTPLPGDAPPAEDAGSRALEDALRSSFFIVKIIMVGLVIVFLASGFFTVDPQHKAILLRFGKPVGEGSSALLGPGFHWAFPAPIDEKVFIPFTSVQSADSTVGWYQSPEDRAKGIEPAPAGPSLSPAAISYVLTSDTNIIHVRATVRYTITDPVKFHFDFADAPVLITNALNNALLLAASEFNVDDIRTYRKQQFHEAVGARLRELIDEQQLGVSVEQPDVLEWPPRYLENKFNEVSQATQRKHDVIQQAVTYADTTQSAARGQAAERIGQAESRRSTLAKNVAAQAVNFTNYLPLYARDPEFFERFRIMQTWNLILTNAQEKMVQPAGTHETRVQISREPLAPPPLAP
ncbi:MAG TPA: SPFH domain-containing protein [Verrucomicrobiae bacterium]|jgi:membrane protease subunit HflK|nr:SPFH domain-containing protein [Verrucomicrobiae bacterium]